MRYCKKDCKISSEENNTNPCQLGAKNSGGVGALACSPLGVYIAPSNRSNAAIHIDILHCVGRCTIARTQNFRTVDGSLSGFNFCSTQETHAPERLRHWLNGALKCRKTVKKLQRKGKKTLALLRYCLPQSRRKKNQRASETNIPSCTTRESIIRTVPVRVFLHSF
jgi:hypothetical protein